MNVYVYEIRKQKKLKKYIFLKYILELYQKSKVQSDSIYVILINPDNYME